MTADRVAAFLLGVVLGALVIAGVTQLNTPERAERAGPSPAPASPAPAATTPPATSAGADFAAVRLLYDLELDNLAFRACAGLDDDPSAARFLYLWIQEAIYQARRAAPDPFLARNSKGRRLASVVSDGQNLAVRIIPYDVRPGEADLDAFLRAAEQDAAPH